MKNCKECGTEFEPENPKGVFCSRACRQKDYRKRKNLELDGYRKAVVELSKERPQKGSAPPEATKSAGKPLIIRSVNWYIDSIRGLEIDEEYRSMEQMILADTGLTKKQQMDLIQGMKTKSI